MEASIFSPQACIYVCETISYLIWWTSIVRSLHDFLFVRSTQWRPFQILSDSTHQIDDYNIDSLKYSKVNPFPWEKSMSSQGKIISAMTCFNNIPTHYFSFVGKSECPIMALTPTTYPKSNIGILGSIECFTSLPWIIPWSISMCLSCHQGVYTV